MPRLSGNALSANEVLAKIQNINPYELGEELDSDFDDDDADFNLNVVSNDTESDSESESDSDVHNSIDDVINTVAAVVYNELDRDCFI